MCHKHTRRAAASLAAEDMGALCLSLAVSIGRPAVLEVVAEVWRPLFHLRLPGACDRQMQDTVPEHLDRNSIQQLAAQV